MRLYDPQKGRILIDGVDIREYTFKSLRRQNSLIPQEPILFQGTVFENVRIGKSRRQGETLKKRLNS